MPDFMFPGLNDNDLPLPGEKQQSDDKHKTAAKEKETIRASKAKTRATANSLNNRVKAPTIKVQGNPTAMALETTSSLWHFPGR
jgi:hypothetical protein